jgi:hypothetical protein
MANKISVILCEGQHDVAFITQILKIIGYSYNEGTKIEFFPKPISDLFIAEVTKANVSYLNLQQARQALFPMNTMQKEKKAQSRNKIVGHFNLFIPKEGEISVLPKETTLSVIYFFDADKEGVDKKLDYINKEIATFSGVSPFTESGTFVDVNGIRFGCYIFSELNKEIGKLEDILLPILIKENEKIFQDAKDYLVNNYDSNRGKAGDYDEQKSLIGIAGQLQKSGSTNTVIISQTDYLAADKISADEKCQKIIAFFNQIK